MKLVLIVLCYLVAHNLPAQCRSQEHKELRTVVHAGAVMAPSKGNDSIILLGQSKKVRINLGKRCSTTGNSITIDKVGKHFRVVQGPNWLIAYLDSTGKTVRDFCISAALSGLAPDAFFKVSLGYDRPLLELQDLLVAPLSASMSKVEEESMYDLPALVLISNAQLGSKGPVTLKFIKHPFAVKSLWVKYKALRTRYDVTVVGGKLAVRYMGLPHLYWYQPSLADSLTLMPNLVQVPDPEITKQALARESSFYTESFIRLFTIDNQVVSQSLSYGNDNKYTGALKFYDNSGMEVKHVLLPAGLRLQAVDAVTGAAYSVNRDGQVCQWKP